MKKKFMQFFIKVFLCYFLLRNAAYGLLVEQKMNFKNFLVGRMKNPRSFLISSRGRRTKFHYGFNDLGARSRKNLNSSKHSGFGLQPLRSASIEQPEKAGHLFCN